ncbi:MAG: hypothetical protein KBF93_13775 [Leptospiraceae bacterium]|nr:hypothetical protein [Leptospiraceae bacterium]
MKTTVEIPDELLKKAKSVAISRGMSFKEVLVHSLASELDNIIDIGISQTQKNSPRRKERKPLSVEFAKPKKFVILKPPFIKTWDFDPVEVLFQDRKNRNDLLLS